MTSLPLRLARVPLLIAAAVVAGASLPALSAAASTSSACQGGAFTVTVPAGTVLKNSSTKVAAGGLIAGNLRVRGRYVAFDVVPGTLGVLNYTMTGAAGRADITGGVRTPVYASRLPKLAAPLAGDLEVRVDDKGGLELRRGAGTRMKIQARDCARGEILQMQPEGPANVSFTHTLAAGMSYLTNPPTQRTAFGNGTRFGGTERPHAATRLSQTATQTVWSVAPGGRMGGVLGPTDHSSGS